MKYLISEHHSSDIGEEQLRKRISDFLRTEKPDARNVI